MKLVPFSNEYLRLQEALPFGVRDADGRLLLSAGQVVLDRTQLDHLGAQALFCDEAESADWRRRLAATMDSMIRRNVSLKSIAEARPQADAREQGAEAERSIGDQWESLVTQLDAVLREIGPGTDWRPRLDALHQRARALAARRFDASLYYLVYTAGHFVERYSCHHALLTLVIGEQAAELLEWPPKARDALGRAALTMNLAMVRLQDSLACSGHPPSPEMRREIDGHAAQGALLLAQAGAGDPLWCETVRLHHDGAAPDRPVAQLDPPRRLARLLRRVDIFAAKMSRRATRLPMSPVQAAREACLGADGRPDEIGAALLKAVGLYPPGSFVELACGEIGIVVSRGRRANLPLVASLVAASGLPLGEPALRDTIDPRFVVRGAVGVGQVKVHPPHERVMALC